MSWIELKLDISNEQVENISAYLFAHGCEGINVKEDQVIVYFTTHRWSNEVQIGLIEFISHVVPGFTRKNIQVTSITRHDWTADWKKHFKPVRITGKIVVQPPWENFRTSQGDLVVRINPKMAFGTGHHESTRLVIIEMEKAIQPGMQVLDLGTGSGILAIVAHRLGAESVLAVDNDMEAVKNAAENLALNNISRGVQIGYAELKQVVVSDYDIILANLNKNILMQYASVFPYYLKSGGILIISGILRSDERTISQEFRDNGFAIKNKNSMKDWLLLQLELVDKKEDNA